MGRGHCANVIENKLKMKRKHFKDGRNLLFLDALSARVPMTVPNVSRL